MQGKSMLPYFNFTKIPRRNFIILFNPYYAAIIKVINVLIF